jgi:hypothetical protein
MSKRKKYRPKRVLVNPVAYVLEGLTPIATRTDEVLKLKVKHHYAMASLTKGVATKEDMDRLINMGNMTEAMFRLGFGTEYADVVSQGMSALLAVCRRGAENSRFILRAEEMKALNMLLELHDAQIEIATFKDVDKAIALVERELKQKRMTNIVERK